MLSPNFYVLTQQLYIRFLVYYRDTKFGEWGCLHIVLADDNVEDHHVQWCVDNAKERGDTEGYYLGCELLKMSKTQRLKIGDRKYKIEHLKFENSVESHESTHP